MCVRYECMYGVGTEKERLTVVQREFSFPAPLEQLNHGASPSAGHHHRSRQKTPGSDEGHPQEAMVKATSCRGELQYRQDWQQDSATGSCIQGEQGSFRMF